MAAERKQVEVPQPGTALPWAASYTPSLVWSPHLARAIAEIRFDRHTDPARTLADRDYIVYAANSLPSLLARIEELERVIVTLYNESVCCIGCGQHAPYPHTKDCIVAPIVNVPPSRKPSLSVGSDTPKEPENKGGYSATETPTPDEHVGLPSHITPEGQCPK